ncbi:Serine/threonine protein kinase, AGC [Metarhizium acridum]|nr:Serine/threonine protein kinase, AGC [Metarhizium acridum]
MAGNRAQGDPFRDSESFARSPSTSTITEKDDKTPSASGAVTPTTESAIGKQ